MKTFVRVSYYSKSTKDWKTKKRFWTENVNFIVPVPRTVSDYYKSTFQTGEAVARV